MPRRRRSRDPFLDLIAPLGGLLALGWFFSPTFRQLILGLGLLLLVLIGLGLLALIAWGIWRKSRRSEPEESAAPWSPLPQPSLRATGGFISLAGKACPTTLAWSQELLSALEWKRFEELVAAYVRELGHDARTTRIGPDGGVDVEIIDRSTGKVGSVIQCKAWDAYKVGVKPVRELLGVMAAAKVTEGAFFTTGDYTSEALVFGRENRIDLVDGREFLKRIRQLSADAQSRLLTAATAGDYTTPTCPSCGTKMLLRTASKGRNEGSEFWGCRSYPRCKQTFRLSKPT